MDFDTSTEQRLIVDTVRAFVERELGRASMALQMLVARPSNILQACRGEQIEEYLLPTIRGELLECLAMTEPGAKKKITAFLVDKGAKGFTVRDGYKSVSHRGYHNSILEFDDCRVPASKVLGEAHRGFHVANEWLSATRLQIAAMCVGRGQRALDLCTEWAASRRQFGQAIGKFQGTSFKLADAATFRLPRRMPRKTETLSNEECYTLMRSGKLAAFEAMLASQDAREGPRAFADKREPVWQGK